jgi:hypothetical protein
LIRPGMAHLYHGRLTRALRARLFPQCRWN